VSSSVEELEHAVTALVVDEVWRTSARFIATGGGGGGGDGTIHVASTPINDNGVVVPPAT
jgi:hypothetical protein